MNVLAIHPGDLHLRAACFDQDHAPSVTEDGAEPQRYVTPSLATLDAGGALLGYPALQAASLRQANLVLWRYRRRALERREVVAMDQCQRGLTSEAFLGFATRRLASDARAWATKTPALALVVPSELSAQAGARVAALVGDTAEQDVALVSEDDAILACFGLGGAPELIVLVSMDDDAARLRVLKQERGRALVLAQTTLPEAGLVALRAAWLAQWNADARELVPDANAFGDGERYEFESLWQGLWECLNAQVRDQLKIPLWPLVRQAQVMGLTLPGAALRAEIEQCCFGLSDALELLLAQPAVAPGKPAWLLALGEPALTGIVARLLGEPLGIAPARRLRGTMDAYARGAARLVGQGHADAPTPQSAAPHALSVLGVAKDGGSSTVRGLIERGAALPATANFSVMANRDTQKRLTLSLAATAGNSPAQLTHRFEFGPLLGQGMQKVNIVLTWGRDGRVTLRASDADSDLELPCMDQVEMASGQPLLGARHVRALT